MFRTTSRAAEKRKQWSKNANAAKARKRELGPPREYPPILPEIRRVITITDYDFGEKTVTMELRRSSRIDCYNCYIDGQLWKSRIGWSRIQEWIRKAFPRVGSFESYSD